MSSWDKWGQVKFVQGKVTPIFHLRFRLVWLKEVEVEVPQKFVWVGGGSVEGNFSVMLWSKP